MVSSFTQSTQSSHDTHVYVLLIGQISQSLTHDGMSGCHIIFYHGESNLYET